MCLSTMTEHIMGAYTFIVYTCLSIGLRMYTDVCHLKESDLCDEPGAWKLLRFGCRHRAQGILQACTWVFCVAYGVSPQTVRF